MNRAVLASMVAGWIAVTMPPAGAQVTIDMSKITCEQWLTYKIGDLDHIAIWLSGYTNGRRNNTQIDLQASKDAVERMKDVCTKSLKMLLMQVLERELGSAR